MMKALSSTMKALALLALTATAAAAPGAGKAPAAMIAFYAGIPVGIVVYSLAAYGVLSWLRRRPKAAA